jgi:hypothetical protein
MKKIVKTPKKVEKVVEVVVEETSTVVEVTGGAETLLGQTVYLACTSYAYTGLLTGVNDKFVEVENPHIVYETGPWSGKDWKDAQKLPTDRLVVYQAQIESMFAVKR